MYITYITNGPQSMPQLDMEQIMNALFGTASPRYQAPEYSERYYATRTIQTDTPHIHSNLIEQMNRELDDLSSKYEALEDKSYRMFLIPKHSGGVRTIAAPSPELKMYLRDVNKFFQHTCKMHSHNDAFAYTKGRCPKDAVIRHQLNESRWFLKLDIKDFFPSSDKEFIMRQLAQLFPIGCADQDLLSQVIDTCLLDGALPQGSPVSPLLTNLLMIPYDMKIASTLFDYDKTHYVYTRYADDLLISSKYKFDKDKIQDVVKEILTDTPYKIKPEKTRFGSSAGRNWNLGIMLTQENHITVGHKRKERLKAALNNLFRDVQANRPWPKNEVQILIGNLAYVDSIEPNWAKTWISKAESKYNLIYKTIIKEALNRTDLEMVEY